MEQRWALYVRMLLAFIAIAVLSSSASAQGKKKAQNKKKIEERSAPWRVGVTTAQRKKALELFSKANEEYGELDFKNAVSHYIQALEIWGHPRIHGNLIAALIQLDQYERALEHIEPAFKYGAAPFAPEVYLTLLNNRRAVENKIATVFVSCELPGAKVTLDNTLLFACPGNGKKIVRTGPHKIVAEKEGFVTTTRDVSAFSNGEYNIAIDPVPLEEVTKIERRWATPLPWSVIGGGLVVASVGVPFLLRAQDNIEIYDRGFER